MKPLVKPLTPRTTLLLAAALIAAHLVAAIWLAATVPWTPDERTYFLAARNLVMGDAWEVSLQRLQGPLGVLPNQLFVDTAAVDPLDLDPIRTAARLGMLVFPLLLLLGTFGWARELWGARGGLLALFLAAASPTVLAYGPLLATDVAVASTTLLTFWMLWRWLDRASLARTAMLGAAFGLLLATKYTGLLLGLAVPLISLIAVLRGADLTPPPLRRSDAGLGHRLLTALIALALVGAVAILTLNACYLFDAPLYDAARLDALQSGALRAVAAVPGGGLLLGLLPEPFVLGADFQAGVSKDFAGRSFADIDGPHWLHYPVSLISKTPPGTLLLLLLAMVVPASRARGPGPRFAALCLAVPALLLLTYMTLASKLQMGIRYLLPMLPLMLVGCGAWLRNRFALSRVGLGLTAVLAGWSLVASISAWPHHIGYFNFLVGGPTGAHRVFADTNCDWYQRWQVGREALRARHDDLSILRPGDDPRFGKIAAYALDLKPSDPQRPGHVYHWLTRFEVIDHDSAAWLVFDASPAAYAAAIARGDHRAAEDLALAELRAGDLAAATAALRQAAQAPAPGPDVAPLGAVLELAQALRQGDAAARAPLVEALAGLGHAELALQFLGEAPREQLPAMFMLMVRSGRLPEAIRVLEARAADGDLRPIEALLLGAGIYWQAKPRDALVVLERGPAPPPGDPLAPAWDNFLEEVRKANAALDKMEGSSGTSK